MRIIGGNDYYDSALAFGRDESLTFIRHKEKLSSDLHIIQKKTSLEGSGFAIGYLSFTDNSGKTIETVRDRSAYGNSGIHINSDTVVGFDSFAGSIFFCGKIYKFVRVKTNYLKSFTSSRNFVAVDEYFYDFDNMVKWFKKYGVNIEVKEFRGRSVEQNRQSIDASFGVWDSSEETIKRMVDAGCTIVHPNLNPETAREFSYQVDSFKLKDFQFQRAVEPFTAFQEISMWIGGVLPNPGNRTIDIKDDKVKRDKKGFDEWSFKTIGPNSIRRKK